MKNWLLPTLAAIFCWGGWAFLPKFSSEYISARSAIVYQGLGGAIVALLVLFNLNNHLETHLQGATISIIAGMLNFLGVLFYIKAISQGSVAIVSTLSALYPLVVIALGFIFLNETLTVQQVTGICFALIAIALIAT
ncbi:MAG: EamA family transporter [Trichodesmium sp.]